MSASLQQLSRFLVVGVWSTTVNYGVFYGLLAFAGAPYLVASAVGFLGGVGAGFGLNKNWTYAHKGKANYALGSKYMTVYLASLALSQIVLYLLVDEGGARCADCERPCYHPHHHHQFRRHQNVGVSPVAPIFLMLYDPSFRAFLEEFLV